MKHVHLILVSLVLVSLCAAVNPTQIVESFIKTLRGFVSGGSFNVLAFKSHQKELDTRFMEIQALVRTAKIPHDDFSRLARFAYNTFSNMKSASDNLLARPEKYPSKSLIKCINELSINFLLVQNSVGDPDPTVNRYREIVAEFRDKVDMFQRASDLLPSEPQLTLSLAKAKIEQVEKVIEEMEEFYPPPEADPTSSSYLSFPTLWLG